MKTAIHIEDLSLRLGGNEILRGVWLDVSPGEYVAIVGPNGAGKSTLLKCLMRIHRGPGGRVEVFSKPLGDYRQWELAQRISYVPQGDESRGPFTVEQFVLMARYSHWSPFVSVKRKDRQMVRDILERTGTAEFIHRRLGTLSGGELQKVHLAAAFAQRADVILLDEPTAFLDYHHQLEIRRLLAEENKESGTTIVAVTHDLNDAALQSDRVVAMREGAVVFNGPPAEIMKPDRLAEIYQAPFVMVEHPSCGMPVVVPSATGDDRQ